MLSTYAGARMQIASLSRRRRAEWLSAAPRGRASAAFHDGCLGLVAYKNRASLTACAIFFLEIYLGEIAVPEAWEFSAFADFQRLTRFFSWELHFATICAETTRVDKTAPLRGGSLKVIYSGGGVGDGGR